LKLVNLISSLKDEGEGEAPFYSELLQLLEDDKVADAFSKIIEETDLILTKIKSERESIFNLEIAICIKSNLKQLVVRLANIISESQNGKASRKMKILNNIYSNLEVNDPLRYDIYFAIVKFSAKNDYMDIIVNHLVKLDLWLKNWGSSVEQKRELFLTLRNLLNESNHKMEAYECLFKYLLTFENADANTLNTSKDNAREAIKEAINNESIFNFEELFKLRSIQNLNSEPCFELAKIFLAGDIKEYDSFVSSHNNIINELSLNDEECRKKIRMLTLVTVVGQEIPGRVNYSVVQEALNVPEEEVELWILDVIRAGLIDAKMNQLDKTIIVNRATPRQFTENEWKKLDTRIDEWKKNLDDILNVIANAKLIAQSH
ncbi:PCI-domain-containing protein, partial [Neocallimastix californiae]